MAKMPPTLLTLPAEIRDHIWDYCLVSPTHRVLAVYYPTPSDPSPSSLIVWTAIRPNRQSRRHSYAAFPRTAFLKTLHLVPCAPTTATPHSPSLLPLAHPLPLVNRQLYAETSTRLWSANTLVLPDYGTMREVLACLGKANLGVQRVEMQIGNVSDLGDLHFTMMVGPLLELARLVQEGALRRVKLVYVDVGADHQGALPAWKSALLTSDRHGNWEGCERELVWVDGQMRTDQLREEFANQWRKEGKTCGWNGTSQLMGNWPINTLLEH